MVKKFNSFLEDKANEGLVRNNIYVFRREDFLKPETAKLAISDFVKELGYDNFEVKSVRSEEKTYRKGS